MSRFQPQSNTVADTPGTYSVSLRDNAKSDAHYQNTQPLSTTNYYQNRYPNINAKEPYYHADDDNFFASKQHRASVTKQGLGNVPSGA